MKKSILLNLMLLLLSWSICAQVATKPAGDGTGTNPYQIASLENLYWISANPNEWGKCFIQTEDIDASATLGWFGGTGWVPIGNGSAPFLGFYNGQGHTISNLFINRPSQHMGLFGFTGDSFWSRLARIENLGVTNVNFSGGVCAGGLVGYNSFGYITNCYSTGIVGGEFYYFGGLVGISTSFSRITSCYSSADVTGAGLCYVGGLVGYLGAGSEISNSYSRGSVTSKEESENPDHPSRTGGLVGMIKENGVIKNCYSTGKVSGIGATGGLVGYADGNQIVTNSFWDTQTSEAALSADGTGKTTAEMTTQSTFTAAGWDFTNIWSINAGNNEGYPDFVLEFNCTNATIALISGYDNQTVCANTDITPIVYEVGGGAASAFISPALPTGFSGYYNANNGTYTISGKSSSAVDYAYSVITFGTSSPCAEATASGTITVHSVTPSVTILSNDDDNTLCEGTSLIFTATPNNTGGGTVSYTWKLNGSTVGTDQNNYVTDTLKNGDRVKCEISLTGGECLTSTGASSNEIQLTVIPNLTPSVTVTSTDADNIICVNTGVTFNAIPHNTGDGTVAYQWDYYNKLQNTLYDYDTWNGNTWYSNELEDGDEIYCEITVTGGNCLTSPTATSDKIIIDVYNTETRPSVTITSNPSGDICPGADVTFTAWPENTGGGTVTYQWYFFCKRNNELYIYDSWTTNPMTIIELEEGDEVYCEITVTDAACFSSAVASSNKIIISEVVPPEAGVITGKNVIQVGESVQFSIESQTQGFWVCIDDDEVHEIASVDANGIVTGKFAGTAIIGYAIPIEKVSPCDFEYAITKYPITVMSGTPPVITVCPGNQTSNTAAGFCSAVLNYVAEAEGSPEPVITYEFSGATTSSGTGTGTESVFNTGETNVTITASNGILPDATCSFKITVTDDEAPSITCAQDITQTADAGICSAELTIASPAATDNCDPDVIVVNSFNNNLVQNGDFNSGTANWQDCVNTAEVNTEEYYIVPLPPVSTNRVAEIDVDMSLCQTISGFTISKEYILTFKATRRQNDDTPNPVSAVVTIDGGALNKVVTRTNTIFNLTPVAFKFTATKTTHQLKFTPHTDNDYVLGFIVDDIAVTQVNDPTITYPVGVTQVVWTAIDMYGNASSCTQNVTVTDNELPVITAEADITKNTDAGLCSAVVTIVDATAEDNCEVGAVTGTRDDALALTAAYPDGTTTITWNVSDVNGNPAVPVTQLVTVMDTEAPAITCADKITQTADQGMCSATVNVVPPAVSDNCDNHVLPISNTELIKNGNFNAGILNWQDCGNKAEVETEEFYIVPLPPKSSNFVAEVDKVMSLCQEISGLTAGHKYALTFKATRRQNTITPNPVSANVVIDGGALSEEVTRTNTTFDLTAESFVFTATQETHKLTFTPSANNTSTLGLVVDDVSVRSITYPVGTTTLVWTATDVYGNTATCEQNITVTDDEVPTLACSSNKIVNVDPGLCQYLVKGAEFDAVYEDNCEIAEVWNSVNGSASSLKDALLDAGTHTITWTVKDGAGNTNSCSFTVTVTDDQLPSLIPTILPTSTTYTSGGWTSTFSGININNTGKTYALVNPGEPVNLKFDWQMVYTGSYCPGCITQHYVTLEASGFNRCNQSWSGGNGLKDYTFNAPATPGIYYISLASSWWYSCNQYYTMYGPNSAENALGYIIVGTNTTCPVKVVKNTDNGECTAVVNYGLDVVPDDNCGIKNLTYTLTGATTDTGEGSLSSYTFNKGVTTVTYTVTDVNQNSYSCDFTVTITDKQAPVPPGNSIQTVECVAQAEEPTEIPVAFDNCDGEVNGFLFSVTDNPDPLIIEGTRIYKYIYTDADGNVSYWTYTYNIIRTSPPHEEGTPVETASTVECFDLAVAPALPDVQDVCGNQLPAPEPVITDTPGDSPCEGTREYRYTYFDDKGLAFVWVYTYTIDDTTPPELVCKNPTIVLDRDGKASIVLEDILDSGSDNCGTINYELIGQTSYSCSDVPSKTVILKATDCAGNIATCEATVTIDLISTRLVYSGATKGQYSDPVNLEATLTEETSGIPIAYKNIVFTLGEQTVAALTDGDGVASATLVLNQNAGPYTLVVTYDEECPYASTTSTSTFIVLLEQACLDYTGVVMASTGSVNSTMATVLLAATFTQENDGYPGKLSDAHIQFFDDEFSPISPVLTPGLVDPNDPTIGSVVYECEVDLEADQSKSYTIYAYTGNRTGYYSNWADLNCILTTIITVYKPGTEFIAGGGYLILEQPSGSVQADVASKNNFGFNVKFNKKGTNLQGNINTIVRKTLLNPETGEFEQHCYQIKGNVLSSLTVGTTVEGSTPAVFTGKANLQDVTDPENPISVDGNFVLKVTMTDKGEPGSSDMISITAFDKSGGIWFTSRWENNIPVEQLLDGGNLVVMGAAKKSAELAIGLEPEVDLTGLKVYPNPFSDRLKFEFSSPVNTQARLLMYDITGKLVCTVFDAPLEQGVTYNVVFIPETEISGMYIYRMIMGDSVFTGKAIYKKNR